MNKVTYDSNNSGGYWWLTDENWKALESAGWNVNWVADEDSSAPFAHSKESGRWLGALATSATREGLSLREAIVEWESVTGESSSALGCACCGTPHYFSSDDGESYSPEYPAYGEAF